MPIDVGPGAIDAADRGAGQAWGGALWGRPAGARPLEAPQRAADAILHFVDTVNH